MKKSLIFSALLLSVLFLPAFADGQIKISVMRVPNTPYFIGMPELQNIDTDEFSTIVLKIRSDKSGMARLFWASSDDARLNGQKCILFNVSRSNGSKDYVFNIKSQSPFWTGYIKQFLIVPDNGPEGFEVGWASAEHGNILTNIKSGWREFWGPESRMVTGTTVNNMKATRLFGTPINWYAYIIILRSSVLMFAYSLFTTRNFAIAWQNCGTAAIIAGIASWAFLEFSNSVDQYGQLKGDLTKYDHKTLEEKRAAIVGKDFYDLLVFCKENIPARSDVDLISSDPNKDFYHDRAKYFLYPLNFYSKEPEYIIVMNYGKGLKGALAEYPAYRMFKKYNEGAYILWKKK